MYDLDSLQGTSFHAGPYSEYEQALEEYTFFLCTIQTHTGLE